MSQDNSRIFGIIHGIKIHHHSGMSYNNLRASWDVRDYLIQRREREREREREERLRERLKCG